MRGGPYNQVAAVVWAVPAGIRWHEPFVEAGTIAAQYAAAIAVLWAVARAPPLPPLTLAGGNGVNIDNNT